MQLGDSVKDFLTRSSSLCVLPVELYTARHLLCLACCVYACICLLSVRTTVLGRVRHVIVWFTVHAVLGDRLALSSPQ